MTKAPLSHWVIDSYDHIILRTDATDQAYENVGLQPTVAVLFLH